MQSSRLNVDLAGVDGRGSTDADNEDASSSDNLRDIDDRREIDDDDECTSSDSRAAAPARQRRAQVVPPIARLCLRRFAASFRSKGKRDAMSSCVAVGREPFDALRLGMISSDGCDNIFM